MVKEKVSLKTQDKKYDCDCDVEGQEKQMSDYQMFMAVCMANKSKDYHGRDYDESQRKEYFGEAAKECARKWRSNPSAREKAKQTYKEYKSRWE